MVSGLPVGVRADEEVSHSLVDHRVPRPKGNLNDSEIELD